MQIKEQKLIIKKTEQMISDENSRGNNLFNQIKFNEDNINELNIQLQSQIEQNSERQIHNFILMKEINYFSDELNRKKNELEELITTKPEASEHLVKILLLLKEVNIHGEAEQTKDIFEKLKKEKEDMQLKEQDEIKHMQESLKTSIYHKAMQRNNLENHMTSGKSNIQNVIQLFEFN